MIFCDCFYNTKEIILINIVSKIFGIFGSVARGEATEESDIDICIETRNPDMFMLVHIKEDLQDIVQKSVDIVRLRERMNPYLKSRIDKEAIYV